ncbi:MAG TPA: hypothetical protein VF444_18135 [Pseudonocardiaceae bacterium]
MSLPTAEIPRVEATSPIAHSGPTTSPATAPGPDSTPSADIGPVAPHRARPGLLAGLTGLLTAGLVVLAVVVICAQVYSGTHGMPGPGAVTLCAHAGAALLAVPLQLSADRRPGARRWLCCTAILLITAAVLWFFWYA